MKDEDVLALLTGENPVCEEKLPSAQSLEARALKERISMTDFAPIHPLPRRMTRARMRRGWWALAATAVVVALVSVVTLPRAFSEEHLGASPAAAAVLERAAKAASAYGGPTAGRYAYTKARTLYTVTHTDHPIFTALVPRVRETWVAADGSGRVVETVGKPIFLGGRDRARWVAAGSPTLAAGGTRDERVRAHYEPVPESVRTADPEGLELTELDELLSAVPQLPTDPDRLERLIRAYAKHKDPPVEAAMFNEISGLLHSPYASGELRAGLYRVLARVDGVELGGQRRDSAGRWGTVIAAPAGYGDANEATADHRGLNGAEVRQLLIDPNSGAVLAEEEVLTQRVSWIDGEPGDVVGAIVILKQGWVDSLSDRPDKSG